MSTPEDEDDVWRTIVENYGERPQLPPLPDEPAPLPERIPDEPVQPPVHEEHEDHFVPEEAPPVVPPRGLRGLAWFGLFGVPTIVLLVVMLRISLPGIIGVALLVWFVGGFVYLVANMRQQGDGDGWDDGAVV